MASLFEHLLETMPLAGAAGAIEANSIDIKQASSESLKRFLRYLAPGESYVAKVPDLDKKLFPMQQGIWGWTYDDADPASITDIWCRVRNADYKAQKVLERLSFGIEEPIGNFRKAVRITTTCNFAVELPLKSEFLVDRWVAITGWLAEDAHNLWPLEALHDRSLVLAFVFDLDANGDPHPMPKDANREAVLKEMIGPLKPHVPANRPKQAEPAAPSDGGQPLFSDITPNAATWQGTADLLDVDEALDDDSVSTDEPWMKRASKDDFMPLDAQKADVGGDVGSVCTAVTGAARILVVVSFTVGRERSTYDPAGANGVGRLWPHIMVKASVPLTKIEASIQFDRPVKTTRLAEPEDEDAETKGCCGSHDVTDGVICSLLVADSNTGFGPARVPGGPPFPFWGNLFNYYLVDPYRTMANDRLHMVRLDRQEARVNYSGWILRKTVIDVDSSEVRKVAKQGEFDNIHMAPRLKLVNVSKMGMPVAGGHMITYPIDREGMRLDDIAMAPFCAHDCFHMHWRWSSVATDKWACGWDESGPFRVAGATMVPLNQEVDVWFRAHNEVTYHAIVRSDDKDTGTIKSHTWQVMMHHGAGYALYFTDYKAKILVEHAFDLFAPPPVFLDQDGILIDAEDATAMFYWWCRFTAEEGFVPHTYIIAERTTFVDLYQARQL